MSINHFIASVELMTNTQLVIKEAMLSQLRVIMALKNFMPSGIKLFTNSTKLKKFHSLMKTGLTNKLSLKES